MQCDIKADLKDIADRAKGLKPGIVTPDEVELARQALRTRNGKIIAAIHIVGLCGQPKDAVLLESFLEGAQNNQFVEYASKALCRYLGLIAAYRPLIKSWVMLRNGQDDARRMTGIFLAKEYLTDFEDDEFGRRLIDILCDLNDGHRGATRDALADVLDLKGKLADPFGPEFSDWDDDTNLVFQQAVKLFRHDKAKLIGIAVRH